MLLREAIQQLAGTKFKDDVTVALAQVETVDADNGVCSCTQISGKTTADLKTVALMIENEDGFLLVPTVGSTVAVMYSNTLLPFIVMFSELDSATWWVNGVITLKDGSLGGIPIVGALLQKINNLENKVNSIITDFNAHIHLYGGDPVSVPTVPITGPLVPTQRAEIENTNVTHG